MTVTSYLKSALLGTFVEISVEEGRELSHILRGIIQAPRERRRAGGGCGMDDGQAGAICERSDA